MEERVWVDGGFGRRVEKTKEHPSSWEEGSFDDVKINPDKKTVLFFDGSGGTNSRTANYGCKFVEGMIGKAKDNNYDLYSFYYGHPKSETHGKFFKHEKVKVFSSFLRPFLFDEASQLLPEEQIDKNLRNLRFYAYCKGMEEINHLLSVADRVLTKGFGEQKSKKLLENVYVVSFAPLEEPKFGTNIEFKSLKDITTKEPWFMSKHASDFCGEHYTGLAQVEFNKDKNGLEVFSNNFFNLDSEINPHQMGAFLKENGVIPTRNTAQDVNGKKVYSRQQAIADLIGISLAYGLIEGKPNLKNVQTMLNTQIKQEENIFFEQEQKEIFKNKTNTNTNTQNGMVLG